MAINCGRQVLNLSGKLFQHQHRNSVLRQNWSESALVHPIAQIHPTHDSWMLKFGYNVEELEHMIKVLQPAMS